MYRWLIPAPSSVIRSNIRDPTPERGLGFFMLAGAVDNELAALGLFDVAKATSHFTLAPSPLTAQASPLWALAPSTQFLVLSTWLLHLPTYGPGAEY